jgi:hypothetical protein
MYRAATVITPVFAKPLKACSADRMPIADSRIMAASSTTSGASEVADSNTSTVATTPRVMRISTVKAISSRRTAVIYRI